MTDSLAKKMSTGIKMHKKQRGGTVFDDEETI